MSMTNFRAVDMPGNANKPTAEPEKKPAAKKPVAAAKKPVAEKVEVEAKEAVVEEEVVLEEAKPTPKGKK